jgi:hypothetical protein
MNVDKILKYLSNLGRTVDTRFTSVARRAALNKTKKARGGNQRTDKNLVMRSASELPQLLRLLIYY